MYVCIYIYVYVYVCIYMNIYLCLSEFPLIDLLFTKQISFAISIDGRFFSAGNSF